MAFEIWTKKAVDYSELSLMICVTLDNNTENNRDEGGRACEILWVNLRVLSGHSYDILN